MSDAEWAVTERTLAWVTRCRHTVMTRHLAANPARPRIRHSGPYREGRTEPGKCI